VRKVTREKECEGKKRDKKKVVIRSGGMEIKEIQRRKRGRVGMGLGLREVEGELTFTCV
jgi:hypothetical protein